MRDSGDGRTMNRAKLVFDILSVLLGLAVIGTGIYTFLGVKERASLFPVIFGLSALFQLTVSIPRFLSGEQRRAGRIAYGFFLLLVAAGFAAVAVISAICLWR